jgi:putative endonuclease
MRAKDQLGLTGEQLAADFLRAAGMEILDRNWRCSEGELDIVAAEGRVLVVCEVKTRSGVEYGTPLEAVNWQKRQRLRRLAVRWVQAANRGYAEIRIDVIGVLRTSADQFQIEHIRGVG